MRIRFYQSGGIAGRMPSGPLEIETAELADDEAKELSRLVEQATECPSGFSPASARPDAFYYRIEVEHPDGVTSEWDAADGEMPSALQPLMSWLRLKNQRS